LERNQLTEINKKINETTMPDKNISFIPSGIDIKVSKKRNIKIYKEFIIINKDLLNSVQKNFDVKYESPIDTKLIIINSKKYLSINNEEQHIILIGNFNNDNNIFNINYIFDYKSKNILMNEIDNIVQDNYNSYMSNYLMINENAEYDISPIFDTNTNIIGFGYKYNDNIDNNYYCDNYYNYEIINIIRLYIFYKQINYIINNKNEIIRDKFYFVNKDWLNLYKMNYEYDMINKELNNNGNIQIIIKYYLINNFDTFNMKNIFSIIKNMKKETNKRFNENLEFVKNQYSGYINFEPDKKIINYTDSEQKQQQIFTVYHNFEIISSKIGKTFNFY
jgi:hypothetical protein